MKSISRKWLIVVAVLLVGLFAVGVPVLASSGNNTPGTVPAVVNSAYGSICSDFGTLGRLASVLGLTPADLSSQLQSGKTLAAITGEKNVPKSKVVDAIIAPYAARVALQVQYGFLTQAQAQTLLDAANQAAANLLTQNLASVTGLNGWVGFCGSFLNAGLNISTGFGMMGSGMMGGFNGNQVPSSITPPAVNPATPPVYGGGMMGGAWGSR